MKKVYLFTHQDMDGISCILLGKLAYSNDLIYKDVGNFDIDKEVDSLIESKVVMPEDIIVFTDIAPGKETLARLESEYTDRVYVLDHHKTNAYCGDILGDKGIVLWEPDEEGKLPCGTSLFFHWLDGQGLLDVPNKPLLKMFVENVRSYDTYQWKGNGESMPKKLQTFFGMVSSEMFVNRFVDVMMNDDIDELLDELVLGFVDYRIQQEADSIEAIVESKRGITEVVIHGRTIAIMNYPGGVNVSELSVMIMQRHPDIEMVLVINHQWNSLNFRVSDSSDLDAAMMFAKPMGGGGHAKACGCSIPKELSQGFLDGIIYHLKHAND